MDPKKEKKTVRIELTDEQKRLVKAKTGKEVAAIELTPGELEQRVSPYKRFH